MKQCFRCYNYGHIGTQCNAAQSCGYCAELHETKNCMQKGVEGFTPTCTVCKGAHTAWSNACPARRKEMNRVEHAKQTRNTYWHVVSKGEHPLDNSPRKRQRQEDNSISDSSTASSDIYEGSPEERESPRSPASPQVGKPPWGTTGTRYRGDRANTHRHTGCGGLSNTGNPTTASANTARYRPAAHRPTAY